MAGTQAKNPTYRVDDNGEWIRITERGEERTGFYFVRGGRPSP